MFENINGNSQQMKALNLQRNSESGGNNSRKEFSKEKLAKARMRRVTNVKKSMKKKN